VLILLVLNNSLSNHLILGKLNNCLNLEKSFRFNGCFDTWDRRINLHHFRFDEMLTLSHPPPPPLFIRHVTHTHSLSLFLSLSNTHTHTHTHTRNLSDLVTRSISKSCRSELHRHRQVKCHSKPSHQTLISIRGRCHCESLGSISSTFHEQFLRVQIPKGQKDTDDLTVSLHFWIFCP